MTITGPFPPGSTLLQFGYTLPFATDSISVRQSMPVQMTGLAVAVQTNGSMRLSSPQLAQQRAMSAQGQSFIVAQGPAVAAGSAVTLDLSGLPHGPVWPRNLSLALASAILLGGAWIAARPKRAAETPRKDTRARERERLFSTLASLDERHSRGEVDERRYTEEREDLVAALSRIYRAGAGEGVQQAMTENGG